MTIGILALQGAFREHGLMIRKCGIGTTEVKLPHQLDVIDGLIIPGGESTTMVKLLGEYGFGDALKAFAFAGKPIFGTCAGAILLADRKDGHPQDLLNLIDIDISRNAYGRQIESREVPIQLSFSDSAPFNGIFIRAPIIAGIGPGVTPLSFYQDRVILARQGNILAATFHPELTTDTRIHSYFIDMICKNIEPGN
jgi:5'-phosphate synthase pdxT subunit